MKIDQHDTEKKVFVIAEIGNNHEGNREVAAEMIGLAAEAGADAVKFQTIVPEKLVNTHEKERLAQLNKLCLKGEDFIWLAEQAKKNGIYFLSTPFDCESVDFLNHLVPAFKIASGDNQFFQMIERIALTGKPIIASTGLLNEADCYRLVDFIQKIWEQHGLIGSLALLHCIVAYPTPLESVNLKALDVLSRIPNIEIGYSDHTIGITACLAAVARGARIIEKHFTLDKNFSNFRDHQLSADPHDLYEMITRMREIESLLGIAQKQPAPIEQPNEMAVRRSWAAARKLTAGHKLEKDDLIGLRPASGLPLQRMDWLGKTITRELDFGEFLTENMWKD
jgi:N,N'-diacetyllegionaminate synthase